MTATSSQRLNLRPTSRSTPTRSKPQAACRARDAVAAGLDAGDHGVEAAGLGGVEHGEQEGRPMPAAVPVAVARRRSPRRWCGRRPAPCTATATRSPTTSSVASDGDDRRRRRPSALASHARWSSSERGTRSNVAVRVLDLVVVDAPDRLGVASTATRMRDPGRRHPPWSSVARVRRHRRRRLPAAPGAPDRRGQPARAAAMLGPSVRGSCRARPLSSVGRAQPW